MKSNGFNIYSIVRKLIGKMKVPLLLSFILSVFVISGTAQILPIDSLIPVAKRDLDNHMSGAVRGNAVTCGTAPNQFTIQIVSDSSYNGYELKCADGCTGYYTVNVTGGIGPFTFQWLGNGNAGTKTTQHWTQVCDQNSIQVLVTDMGQNVTCAASHVLNVPGRLQTINFTLTPPSCYTSCDGTATHSPVFGVSPYSFSWTNGETTQNASALCIGSSTLTITDQNGCQFDTTVNITSPPPIYANIAVSEVSCNNACDGSLTSNPSGGTGSPYTFDWTNTAGGGTISSTNTASGLCETNMYNLHLIDNSGCFIDTAVTLADKLPMILTVASSTDAQCSNVCNGQVSISVSGGAPPYVSYSWYQGTFGNGVLQSFSGASVNSLCSNTDYYVVVTDSDGCSDSLQISQLSSPPAITISETHTDVSCFNANDGTITLTVSGGVSASGTYTYNWTTSDGSGLVQSAQNQTGLSKGTYTITVTDDVGCQQTATITIAEPTEIMANGVVIDATCFNLSDGQINLTTSGGAGGYSWTWTSTNGSFVDPGMEDLSNLDSASYSVHIVDINGCIKDTTLHVSKPQEIYVNGVVTPILCNGDNNAQITINPVNGTGTYLFDWSNLLGTNNPQNQTGLSPNTYNLSVRDGNGCQKDTTFVVNEPPLLTVTTSSVKPHCGQSDGSVTATAGGGTPPYTYVWKDAGANTIGTSATVSGLSAGCYDVTVTDANGCTATQQECITDETPPSVALTPTDASCFGVCDGSITVVITNGTAPYNTVWTSTDAGFSDPNTDDINGLCAADYTLQVTDAFNCIVSQTATIAEPTEIMANGVVTDATCFNLSDGQINLTTSGGAGGYSWTWTSTNGSFVDPGMEDLSNLDSASYSVHIVDINGCIKDTTLHVSKPQEIYVNGVVTPILCNGDNNAQITINPVNGTGTYLFDWSNLLGTNNPQNQTGLSPNTYNLSVRDGNGCQKDTTFVVNEPPLLTVTTSSVKPHCGQSDGSVTATAGGGTPPYTYVWKDAGANTIGTSATVSGLSAGCYDVTVTDANGCTATQQECITDETPPSVALTPTDASCFGVCDGSITVVITNGTAPYNTVWTSTDAGFSDPNTDDINGLCAADYTLQVTDAFNCTVSQTVTIAEPVSVTVTGVVTDVNCNGGSDGAIDITAQGGTVASGYSFNWTGQGGFTSSNEDVSGLVAGNYSVTVIDDNNCSANTNFTINEPSAISISMNSSNAQCGQNTGSLTATVTGGTAPYSYAWADGGGNTVGGNNPSVNNQPSGTYTLTVTDANMCAQSMVGTISDDNGPTVVIDNSGDVTCAGASDGFINISAGGGLTPLSFSWSSIPVGFASTSEDINQLVGNTTYTITVTDANGCTANQSVLINEPLPVSLTATLQNPSCNGVTNGAIDLFVSGGTALFTFDWDNDGTGDFDDTEDLTGLSAGTYSIAVMDNNSCVQNASFTLVEPTAISLTTSSISSNCLQSDGSVSVVPSGGTPNYNFQWMNAGQTVPVLGVQSRLGNQPSGCYDVVVTDANGCTEQATACISDLAGASLSFSSNDVTCNGGSDGSITLAISGGQTPYNPIVWTGPTAIANGTLNVIGLTVGVYAVQVTDGSGCIVTGTQSINEPLPITLSANLGNPICNGSNNGQIDLTVNDAVGTVSYSWMGPTGFIDPGTEDLNGLSTGQYCVTVSDANACTASQCFTLNEPTAIVVSSSNTPTGCSSNSGTLSANASGGVPPYSYSWVNSLNTVVGNAANLINMPADTYTLTVTDANGCTTTAQEILGVSNAPVITLVTVNNVLCKGNATGSLVIAVSGGTSPYSFDWDNLPGTNDPQNQNGLPAGTYNVVVTDAAGCSSNLAVTINEPATALTASSIGTDVNCNGEINGAIDLTVSGGTPSYSFLWSNNSTTEDLNGILAGIYSVIVTDNNGCVVNDTVTINEPSALVLSSNVSDATCGSSNGSINVTVVGGQPNYQYGWSDVTNTQPGTPLSNTTNNLTSVGAGAYQIIVTDNNGCKDSSLIALSNTNGPQITYTTTDVLCYGSATGAIDITVSGIPSFTYNWSGTLPFTGAATEDVSNLEAGTYTVVVTDGNGCVTSQVIVINGPIAPIQDNAVVSNLNCFEDVSGGIDLTISGGTPSYVVSWLGSGGFSSSSEDLSGLISGVYNLHIVDANACTYDNSYTVSQPDSIHIVPNITQPTCGLTDGSISLIVTGGTVANSYTYQWVSAGNVIGTANTLSNIGAGNYTVTVTDDNGCSNSRIISISDFNAPPLSVNIFNVDCFGNSTGAIDLTVGGTNSYTYDWDIDGVGDNDDTEDLTNLSAGTYNVTVTDVTTTCTASISASVTEPYELQHSVNVTNLTCNGDNTGGLDLSVHGGTTPYLYDWDNDGTGDNDDTQDLSGLSAGNYTIVVTDGNGCVTGAVYTVTEPLVITTQANVINNNCFGETLGSIDLSPSNGTAPYTFSWTGPSAFTSSTEDISNLSAGIYTVMVTDFSGCTKDTSITITEPNPISISFNSTNATCNSTDGALIATVNGGTPAYSYDWQNGGVSLSNTNILSNVGAGTYLLAIVDANGCQKDTLTMVNNVNAPIITFDSLHNVLCTGDNNGDIYVSVSGGVVPYTYVWNPNAIAQTEDLLQVSSGNYTLTVTDANGCLSSFDTTLIEPSPIGISSAITDATCGDCNGGASLTVTGGSGTYTYSWANNSTSAFVQNMCPGVYPVQVTDGNGCSSTDNIIINNTGGPTGENITVTNVSCSGGNNGAITITALGGTAPYSYYWVHDGSTTNSVSNLPAGVYIVQMTDANGCMRSVSIQISEPTPIVVQGNITPATCMNNDGSIALAVSGGTAPYTISWSNSLGNTSTINNLSSGNYDVTVTDAHGCSQTASFIVPNANAPIVGLMGTDVLCNGNLTGSISSNVSGNVGAVSYQWFNNGTLISGQNNAVLPTIGAGDYSLLITDNTTGCQAQSFITITEPPVLALAQPIIIDASCDVSCDGFAEVYPAGGVLAYSYQWNNGETTQDADSLCSGVNTVLITDANGCTIEQNIQIETNLNLTATMTNTDATCGSCNGESSIVPSGGSGNYSVLWADGITTLSHTGLCVGVHPISVIDDNGCSIQVQSVINNIGGPDGETISVNDVSCNGGSDGSVLVSPTGGTQPYTYFWIPTGATTSGISNITAGDYFLEVTDSNHCTRVVPVTVNEPQVPTLNAVVVNSNCGNNDGSISVTVTGSNPPYSFSWTGVNGFTSTSSSLMNLEVGIYNLALTDASGCTYNFSYVINSTSAPNLTIAKQNISCFGLCDGQATVTAQPTSGAYSYNWISQNNTSATINNLCAGNYIVEVTDNNTGCKSTQSTTINQPDSITIEIPFVENPQCYESCDGVAVVVATGGSLSYTYLWDSGSSTETQNNLCVGDSKVIITDANGCKDSLVLMVEEPTEIMITIDSTTNSQCKNSTEGAIYTTVTGGTSGYTYSWQDMPNSGYSATTEDITGLLPTNYILTVTDAHNCIKMDTVGIDTIHIVIAHAGADTSICIGECTVFIGTGEGTTGSVTNEWFDEYGNSVSSIDTLSICPDTAKLCTFIFQISDAFCSDVDSVELLVNDLPIVDAGEDEIALNGSVITLGGEPTSPAGVSYEWTPLTNLFTGEEQSPNPQITLNDELDYIVTVVDTNGCVNSDTIHVKPLPNIYFPNGFTPNGDGVNDYWQIDLIQEFPQAVVEVYNRWGEMLFRSVGYNEPWDGLYKGKILPVGTYYYVIELNDPNFPDAYTGPVTIMR